MSERGCNERGRSRLGGLGMALALALGGLAIHGCEAPTSEAPEPQRQVDGDDVPSGWRAPAGACALDPAEPSRLVLTTTDFATGAITVVDLDDGSVEADVAVGSTDAVPFEGPGTVVVVHRYQLDRIDVLDADTWALRGQHAVPSTEGSANPHAVAFDERGRAWVTTFGDPWLRALDLGRAAGAAELARVDLSVVADDDGNPEASLAVACGDLVLVTVQRLDPGFRPLGTDALIAVDAAEARVLDLEPRTPGVDGLPLLGGWVRQLRRDPSDPHGRTLLGLSTGIERVELDTGRREWAVTPEVMAMAGIEGRLQPQAFDVDERGAVAYVAAYDADFSQVQLYRVGLDGGEPHRPESFADRLDSVEQTLEVVGDELWYGSTRAHAPGLWRFDLGGEVPTVIAGPIDTGLAPYSMVVIR